MEDERIFMLKRKTYSEDFHCTQETPKKRSNARWKGAICPCGRKDCSVTEETLRRILDDGCEMSCYSRRVPRNVKHVGQLKLLLSEIEFLTPYKNQSITLVYAGAAPGFHIPRLVRMFPLVHFVLVDPNKSVMSTMNMNNVTVLQCEMTDNLAAELKGMYGTKTLFVSDVRVGPASEREADIDQQRRIHKDMLAQMQWFSLLDPMAGMFKFRLPWDMEASTEYLDGLIHLPVFGRFLTHESRLVVQRGARMKTYDNSRYEGQMAHFNQKLRTAIYPGGRCYDCTVFRHIIQGYLEKPAVDEEVEMLCSEIESELEFRDGIAISAFCRRSWVEVQPETGVILSLPVRRSEAPRQTDASL